MSDFKNLVDKIISDAELKKRDIVDKAKEESEKIVLNKIEEANDYKEKILNRARVEGKELREKMISKCELKIRNNRLDAKRKVLDEIFDKSLSQLLNLDKDEFKSYLVRTLNNLKLNGEYGLLISSDYSDIIPELLVDLNSKVSDDLKILEVKPSDNLKGGFILEKDGVFVNYSFEVLVDSIRDEIEFEVSNLLFN